MKAENERRPVDERGGERMTHALNDLEPFPTAKNQVEKAIASYGFTLRYVDYCEDGRTPGLLGMFAGVTDWQRKEVKIRTKGRTDAEILETLGHELHHVTDPSWDCGSRDAFGRGHREG
jgi:hypothetical protein